ncbi:pyridoxal-phosphate dependent enzyme [Actinomadura fulvescens]|uniref:Tryptophan synthase beta chain-like PALP domain-containing protein n=1 Tax=Actinomadura fulvescens TaxID=46160 RepID=A0ABN3QG96_9ACTN
MDNSINALPAREPLNVPFTVEADRVMAMPPASRSGRLRPGAPSTSGTFGLGLAMAGMAYGHPIVPVGDPGMEPLQDARRLRVAELVAEVPGAYCPDQYNNPDNVEAYASLAHELLERFRRIDVLVCAVRTGGHSAGVARAARTVAGAARGLDRFHSVRAAGPAPVDAWAGFQHLPAQCRVRVVLRGALGQSGRSCVGAQAAGAWECSE